MLCPCVLEIMSVIFLDLLSGKKTEVQRLVMRTFKTVSRIDLESCVGSMSTRLYAEILHIKKPTAGAENAVFRRRVGALGSSSNVSARFAKVELQYFRMLYLRMSDEQVNLYEKVISIV